MNYRGMPSHCGSLPHGPPVLQTLQHPANVTWDPQGHQFCKPSAPSQLHMGITGPPILQTLSTQPTSHGIHRATSSANPRPQMQVQTCFTCATRFALVFEQTQLQICPLDQQPSKSHVKEAIWDKLQTRRPCPFQDFTAQKSVWS
jgi:hypothetical protein